MLLGMQMEYVAMESNFLSIFARCVVFRAGSILYNCNRHFSIFFYHCPSMAWK